jgi:hypothetical protein
MYGVALINQRTDQAEWIAHEGNVPGKIKRDWCCVHGCLGEQQRQCGERERTKSS